MKIFNSKLSICCLKRETMFKVLSLHVTSSQLNKKVKNCVAAVDIERLCLQKGCE